MAVSPQQRIRDFYGFDLPDDFFRFADFMKELPDGLLRDVLDITPAYPFALAEGKLPEEFPEHPFWEDRYYHDLPEFVTLLNGHTDGLHYGYFFDAPSELPPVVAHYWHSDTFQHTFNGDHLFDAIRWEIEQQECFTQEAWENGEEDEDHCRKQLAQTASLRGLLGHWWGGDRPEIGLEYMDTYEGSEWRASVADTWDGLGIVVAPGLYRPLTSDPFAQRHPTLTEQNVASAAEEALALLAKGFPAATLKLGRDLWAWKRYPVCYDLLDTAYASLGREPLRRLLTEARAWRARCDELAAKRGR